MKKYLSFAVIFLTTILVSCMENENTIVDARHEDIALFATFAPASTEDFPDTISFREDLLKSIDTPEKINPVVEVFANGTKIEPPFRLTPVNGRYHWLVPTYLRNTRMYIRYTRYYNIDDPKNTIWEEPARDQVYYDPGQDMIGFVISNNSLNSLGNECCPQLQARLYVYPKVRRVDNEVEFITDKSTYCADIGLKKPGGIKVDFGDKTPIAFCENPKHTYTKAGKYEVVLTLTDEREKTSIVKQNIYIAENQVGELREDDFISVIAYDNYVLIMCNTNKIRDISKINQDDIFFQKAPDWSSARMKFDLIDSDGWGYIEKLPLTTGELQSDGSYFFMLGYGGICNGEERWPILQNSLFHWQVNGKESGSVGFYVTKDKKIKLQNEN